MQRNSFASSLLQRTLREKKLGYESEYLLKRLAPGYRGLLRVDCYVPALDVAIEVNGDHHGWADRLDKDGVKRSLLVYHGVKLVIWNVTKPPKSAGKVVNYLLGGKFEPVKVFWN